MKDEYLYEYVNSQAIKKFDFNTRFKVKNSGFYAADEDTLLLVETIRKTLKESVLKFSPIELHAPEKIHRKTIESTCYDTNFPHLLLSTPDKDYYYPPACCHHVFELCNNTQIHLIKNFYIQGMCFRNEGPSIDRLRAFEMHEFVSIGPRDLIEKTIDEMYKINLTIFEKKFNISFFTEYASDHFIGENAVLNLAQIVSKSKIEFSTHLLDSAKPLACSSLNRHGHYFTSKFKIGEADQGNTEISSFCLAWGIHRIAIAILSQHGNDWRDHLNV